MSKRLLVPVGPPILWPMENQTFWSRLADVVVPTNPIEFWTMVAGLASVGILVTAALGLRSLVLAKRDMKTRATRESKARALDLLDEFAEKLIPRNGDLSKKLRAAGIRTMVKKPSDVQFGDGEADQVEAAQEWMKKVPPPVMVETVQLLNHLEAWATHLVCGVADHDLAYDPCAPVFCSMVIQHYGTLVDLRGMAASGKYTNVVKLFLAWQERMERERADLQKGDMLKQVEELEQRASYQHTLSPPIGTGD